MVALGHSAADRGVRAKEKRTKHHFQIPTDLNEHEALGRVAAQLAKRSVPSSREGAVVTSGIIPMPLLSFDRRLYSRDSFIGFNPFVMVDRIVVTFAPGSLDVSVIQWRPLAFIILIAVVGLAGMRIEPRDSAIFLTTAAAIFAALVAFVSFHVLGRRCLETEIKRGLEQAECTVPSKAAPSASSDVR